MRKRANIVNSSNIYAFASLLASNVFEAMKRGHGQIVCSQDWVVSCKTMTGVLKLYPRVPTLQQYAMMFAWSVTVSPKTSKDSIWDHHQRMACKEARAEGMPGTAAPVFQYTGLAQPGAQVMISRCCHLHTRTVTYPHVARSNMLLEVFLGARLLGCTHQNYHRTCTNQTEIL